MDFAHMYSSHHYLLYNFMLEHFGPKAHYESLESFFKQNFLFCFNLGRNPRLGEYDTGITKDAEDRKMGFVEAGTLEVGAGAGAVIQGRIHCYPSRLWVARVYI